VTAPAEDAGRAQARAMAAAASLMTAREANAYWRGFDSERRGIEAREAVNQENLFEGEK
jgi:hypothetical protein